MNTKVPPVAAFYDDLAPHYHLLRSRRCETGAMRAQLTRCGHTNSGEHDKMVGRKPISHRSIAALFCAAVAVGTLSGCANPQPQVSLADARQTVLTTTHMLVCKDSFFSQSIPQILPNGVHRMTQEEASRLSVVQSAVFFPGSSFLGQLSIAPYMKGKYTEAQIRKSFGVPFKMIRNTDGRIAFSYNASGGSIVVFVFSPGGSLEKIYGYTDAS